eukprot:2114831-Pleurochrysis_carterae.AAC.1
MIERERVRARMSLLEHGEARYHRLQEQVMSEADEQVVAEYLEEPWRLRLAEDGLLARRRRRKQQQLSARLVVAHAED